MRSTPSLRRWTPTIQPVVDKVLDPILPKLIESIYGVPAPAGPRNDLAEIFLTGISKAGAGIDGDPATVLPVDLNSQTLNADAADKFQPSEMLRLNMSIPPTAEPNNLGVLAGDLAGFPNGRRLADDVIDISIQAVEGAAITGEFVEALMTGDGVTENDVAFGETFPYLGLPHSDSVNNGSTGSDESSGTDGSIDEESRQMWVTVVEAIIGRDMVSEDEANRNLKNLLENLML